MGHIQTYAKVNAKVDVGIVPLIEALSLFPGLETIESCQRDENGAWVCFQYGEGWRSLAEFVFSFFGPELERRVADDAAVVMRYAPGGGFILADLTVRPGMADRVAVAIAEIASAFPDAISRRITMTGLAHSKQVAEDGRTASGQVMDMPISTEQGVAASRMVSAGLHGAFALATGALVNIISECHRTLSLLPLYDDSGVVPNDCPQRERPNRSHSASAASASGRRCGGAP
jgi:hypothetical protein